MTIDSIIEGMLKQTTINELRIKTNADTWSRWFRGLAKVLESNKCLEELKLLEYSIFEEPTEDDTSAFSAFLSALKKNSALKKVELTGFQSFGVPKVWIERNTKTIQ